MEIDKFDAYQEEFFILVQVLCTRISCKIAACSTSLSHSSSEINNYYIYFHLKATCCWEIVLKL
jgi:hypothetical protein